MNNINAQFQHTLHAGSPLESANVAVLLLHGRGASAHSMLSLANDLQQAGCAFIIPQADMNTWYPYSAFAPLANNQPYLDNALATINAHVDILIEQGFTSNKIMVGGFSQGACLASEFVARDNRTFGGLFVFSGALIGPLDRERNYAESHANMPIFIGSSDTDPWVQKEYLDLTAKQFENMGASVDYRIYPNMPHTTNQDEVEAVKEMLQAIN